MTPERLKEIEELIHKPGLNLYSLVDSLKLIPELIAEIKRLREVLEVRSKRSSYQWSSNGEYTADDWKNEGSIECARDAIGGV